METLPASAHPLLSGIRNLFSKWWLRHPILLVLGVGITLLACFCAEEYWRGRHAWEQCKRELLAKGAILDCAALTPPTVPDEMNFFKAPGMTNWFSVTGQNEFMKKLSTADLAAFAKSMDSHVLAEIKLVGPETPVTGEAADLVLDYDDCCLSLSTAGGDSPSDPSPAFQIIPLIMMDQVPLADAIRNLARQEGMNYLIDPATQLGMGEPQPTVSFHWENLTAHRALRALLSNYNLQIARGARDGIARITAKGQTDPKAAVEAATRERLDLLVRSALEKGGNELPVQGLRGSQDLMLVAKPFSPVKPLRVVVQTDESLTGKQVAQFFSTTAFTSRTRYNDGFRVEPSSATSFQVFLGPLNYYAAADYLAWSDRCAPEFEMVRAALKRPYAQTETRPQEPLWAPIPNFITARVLAQTLSQRAQCYLLLNQPEAALQELTLIHDLRHTLSSKPTTLVAAMINVAVTGLYVSTVADGLRLKVWQESQLAIIEEQLRDVKLIPPVVDAFQHERLHLLRILETGQLAAWLRISSEVFAQQSPQPPALLKLKNAGYSLLALVPRGWVYQNMATVGYLHQDCLDAVDAKREVIFANQFDAAADRTQEVLHQRRPETFLAAIVFPNFMRAWQTLAQNQTLVNEAFLACALERHRLARGRYPQSLEALTPEFAAKIPADVINGQPLHYQSTEDGRFLLYSVGWNTLDDGGLVSRSEGRSIDLLAGDWVWSNTTE